MLLCYYVIIIYRPIYYVLRHRLAYLQLVTVSFNTTISKSHCLPPFLQNLKYHQRTNRGPPHVKNKKKKADVSPVKVFGLLPSVTNQLAYANLSRFLSRSRRDMSTFFGADFLQKTKTPQKTNSSMAIIHNSTMRNRI
jgi:hypothetical protein